MKKACVISLLMALSVLSLIWTILLAFVMLDNKGTPSVSLMHLRNTTVSSIAKPSTSMVIKELPYGKRKLYQDDTLVVEYLLLNVGEDTLFIQNINPDCLCTDFSISSDTAAPSDSICLKLVIDLSNKFGRNLVHVVIESNTEKRMDIIKLPFYVEYPSDDTSGEILTKKRFSFKQMKINEEKTIQSFVVNSTSKILYLSVMTPCDCIDVNPRSMMVKPNARCEYSIIIKPRMKGEYSEYFMFRIDGAEDLIRIDVNGYVN